MANKKLLVIFGISGQQGGSLAETVLADPELSSQFSIRGLTRDVSNPSLSALKQRGIEIVAADADDAPSLERALVGAHTVFGMTVSQLGADSCAHEMHQARAIADACVSARASMLIFSIVPSPKRLSGGQIELEVFDVKVDMAEYIAGLPIKSAFYAPAFFMQNFHNHLRGIYGPKPDGKGGYVLQSIVDADAPWPLIDVAGDTGKFVAPVLRDAQFWNGKTIAAAGGWWSMRQMAAAMSKSMGKSVRYERLELEEFKTLLPAGLGDWYPKIPQLVETYKLYGPDEVELVHEAQGRALQKPTSLDEYLAKHPFAV